MKKGLCIIFLIFISQTMMAFAEDAAVGSVRTLKGSVSIVRQNEVISAKIGSKIFQDDVLQTGHDSSVGIILRDNTIFSLGSESEFEMKEFQFAPAEGKFSLLARMAKGTFSYLSGVVGKRAPGSVHIETPVGTIGIRGTKFLAKIVSD